MADGEEKKGRRKFWTLAAAAVLVRVALVFFQEELNLGSRPEVATPLTSLRRLAEGYWLKQSSISPYAGSMYHGSPLLLAVIGPLTVKRVEGPSSHILCSLVFIIADIISALLIRATGQNLQLAYQNSLGSLNLKRLQETSRSISAGDLAALIYFWNPMTIVACVGLSTSPIENMMVVLSVYGACSRLAPLAAFGWVLAVHLSLYPILLIIPIILLLGYGPDAPPAKLFVISTSSGSRSLSDTHDKSNRLPNQMMFPMRIFSWRLVGSFIIWASIWSLHVLILSSIYLNQFGGLSEMFKKTYGFILTVEDLSPNIGVLWYFFAEVFDFFRVFFLLVFHMNILFMILPLAIRLYHRPCFLAFVYIAISSLLKSYPSVGDSALYLGLLGFFINELAEMHFSFLLFGGYIGLSFLSPVMHNLWIWRGTGNANFYFATAIAYASLQILLVVESVSAMLSHDRMLRKLSLT
ncbi:hypothetical protein QJS10_CPB22g01093 [Acorus calamus]|uniref:GPI transamidase subunit PIG-U n=1 Tax=Acorus calamus TaxID=4465 RepID=A0AAV9BY61_ACOCL|nr:hypothetical protein QJS10_CPB22g01093 [Acorus calamus]